jgi:hypothetical protein
MGGASIVGQIAGNVTGALGQAKEAGMSAEQARRNAILSEYAAKDAEARGAAEAAAITSKGTQTIASARVATAASGIELDSPTAMNVVSTTRAYSALDALMAKSNAAREAWGYRQEGEQFKVAQQQARKKSELTPLALFTGKSGGF